MERIGHAVLHLPVVRRPIRAIDEYAMIRAALASLSLAILVACVVLLRPFSGDGGGSDPASASRDGVAKGPGAGLLDVPDRRAPPALVGAAGDPVDVGSGVLTTGVLDDLRAAAAGIDQAAGPAITEPAAAQSPLRPVQTDAAPSLKAPPPEPADPVIAVADPAPIEQPAPEPGDTISASEIAAQALNATTTGTLRLHKVAPGDTLASIARQYYGDGDMAQRIFYANRATLRMPDALFPGQQLRIPDS